MSLPKQNNVMAASSYKHDWTKQRVHSDVILSVWDISAFRQWFCKKWVYPI